MAQRKNTQFVKNNPPKFGIEVDKITRIEVDVSSKYILVVNLANAINPEESRAFTEYIHTWIHSEEPVAVVFMDNGAKLELVKVTKRGERNGTKRPESE